MKLKEKRNNEIVNRIDTYKKTGFTIKEAVKLVAKLYFLSDDRTLDIYYGKKV